MKVRLLLSIPIVVLFIGCDKDPASSTATTTTDTESSTITTTTYTWSSVEAFTSNDCSGDATTGHCMTNYSLSETDCGDSWMDFYSYYTTDLSMPTVSIALKSDNTAIYTSGTTGLPCTYTESNNTITVALTSDTVLEFTRDGDSLRQNFDAEDNASGCTQFIYTM